MLFLEVFVKVLKTSDWICLIQAEGEDFEALPWYSAVEKFCHGQGYEESENADEKTLPAIIEKAILPKIRGKPKFFPKCIFLYFYFCIRFSKVCISYCHFYSPI